MKYEKTYRGVKYRIYHIEHEKKELDKSLLPYDPKEGVYIGYVDLANDGILCATDQHDLCDTVEDYVIHIIRGWRHYGVNVMDVRQKTRRLSTIF